MTSVIISNSNNELFYIMHYTCLKDVFQKLIIDNGSSGFNFHDDVIDRMITISLKVFFHFSIPAKQDGNAYFIFQTFTYFDLKAQCHERFGQDMQNIIAVEKICLGRDQMLLSNKYINNLPQYFRQ